MFIALNKAMPFHLSLPLTRLIAAAQSVYTHTDYTTISSLRWSVHLYPREVTYCLIGWHWWTECELTQIEGLWLDF